MFAAIAAAVFSFLSLRSIRALISGYMKEVAFLETARKARKPVDTKAAQGKSAIEIIGFDTLSFSTCQSPRSDIIRHIEINDLSEHSIGKMVSSSPLLN
jgi:hypothetical protein